MVLLIALIALAGAGFFFSHVSGTYGRADIASLISGQAGGSALAQRTDLTTTAIRPASEADQVSAAGNIELSGQRPVVLRADGIVSQVAVEVGDVVAAGDLLVSLDTADLEWAVKQAELHLASAQVQLNELLNGRPRRRRATGG